MVAEPMRESPCPLEESADLGEGALVSLLPA